MSEIKRPEALQIVLAEEELTALDAWRSIHHLPSRAAAIRELLKRGLAAEGVEITRLRTKSSEYGVRDGSGCKAARNS